MIHHNKQIKAFEVVCAAKNIFINNLGFCLGLIALLTVPSSLIEYLDLVNHEPSGWGVSAGLFLFVIFFFIMVFANNKITQKTLSEIYLQQSFARQCKRLFAWVMKYLVLLGCFFVVLQIISGVLFPGKNHFIEPRFEIGQTIQMIADPSFAGDDFVEKGTSYIKSWQSINWQWPHGILVVLWLLGALVIMRIGLGQILAFTNKSSEFGDSWNWTRGHSMLMLKIYGLMFLVFTGLGLVGLGILQVLPIHPFIVAFVNGLYGSVSAIWMLLVFVSLIRHIVVEKS
ncbi:MAG: hypothetical protein CMM87_00375 [Rickettsiales bacterium]|nr:hypothetical protein [Rickettsiales bacterium]|tara:strand:- start:7390 stop:8244 length:855 start_codon:yes stop_codon:yes gene_type:complete